MKPSTKFNVENQSGEEVRIYRNKIYLAYTGSGNPFRLSFLFIDSSFQKGCLGRQDAFAETQQLQPSIARTRREMGADEVPIICIEGRVGGSGGCGLGGAEFGERSALKLRLECVGA